MRFGYTGDNGDGTFSPGVFNSNTESPVQCHSLLSGVDWSELKCLPCPNLSRVNSLKDFSLKVVSECVCHCFCVGQVMSSHQMSSKVKSMTVMIFKEATEG